MRFWTLATRETLPHARVLADGLRRHEGSGLSVLLAGPPPAGDEPFDAFDGLADVDPALVAQLLDRPWPRVAAAAQVALLRRELARGAEQVALLAPETVVRAPLDGLRAALARHDVALVPRLLGDLPDDGLRPSGDDLRAAGLHVPGDLAVRAGGEAEAFLDWWEAGGCERARLDLAPARFDHVTTVRDPAIGVSAWSAHERADSAPLALAHLHGFDPMRPWWLAEGFNRIRLPERPRLAALCEEYAAALVSAGWAPPGGVPAGTELPNGLVLDARMGRLLATAELQGLDFGDLRADGAAERFAAWLAEPADRGAAWGVNRYTRKVWSEREDVMRVFADLDGPEGAGFAEWLWEWGRREMAIPDRFMPPLSGRDATAPESAAAADAEAEADAGGPDLPGVHVIGYMRGALGLGAAARLYVEAVRSAGLEATTTTVVPPAADATTSDVYAEVEFEGTDPGESAAEVDLVCVNADELPMLAEQLGGRFGTARRTIGVWAWETDDIPERWGPAFDLVDELWVYTGYVAQTIARVSPVPVVTVPIPVPRPDPAGASVDLGVPEGFRFLFVFDFLSTVARKNPAGLIEAFTRAFAPGEGPQLVLKTLHAALRPAAYDQLRLMARDRPDVHIVDRSLSVAERDALMESCDCYVSLHRAEGFGLTMAEAMALGKPVIATAYSGNLDFMTPMNSYLVDYAMTRVGPEGEQYPAEGTWADPDVDHAATLLRRVLEHPDEARVKGERAARDIERLLSAEAVARIVRARLEHLRARGAV